jgi:hypothetical protein
MRENWGVPDSVYEKVLCFRTSLYAHRWSVVYGKDKFKVDVDMKQERIYILKATLDEIITDKTVYWTFEDVHKGAKKLEGLARCCSIQQASSHTIPQITSGTRSRSCSRSGETPTEVNTLQATW